MQNFDNEFVLKMIEEGRMDEIRNLDRYSKSGLVPALQNKKKAHKPFFKVGNLQQTVEDAQEKVSSKSDRVSEDIKKICEEYYKFIAEKQEEATDIRTDSNLTISKKMELDEAVCPNLMTNHHLPVTKVPDGIVLRNSGPVAKGLLVGILASDKEGGRPHKDKPNPKGVANKLLQTYNFALHKESVYLFLQSYYRSCSKTEICRLINYSCQQEVYDSRSSSFLGDVYSFIFHESSIVRNDDSFDDLLHLVAFRNGFLDLREGLFYPPNPKYFFTHCIDINYDINDNRDCPRFKSFLYQISQGDDLLIQRIWEAIGYIFTNDIKGKNFFLFQGVSNSGKSTLGDFISSFFPEEARISVCLDEFENNFAISNLYGKAICTDLDLSAGKIGNRTVGRLKRLTGNDDISADVKYQSRVKFRNRAKLVFATNHDFEMATEDPGVLSRVVVIPFEYSIPREGWNIQLLSSFENEKLSIVKEALRHYCRLVINKYCFSGNYELNKANGLNKEEKVTIDNTELVRQFVSNCCEITSFDEFSFTADIYNAFVYFYSDTLVALVDVARFSELLNRLYNQHLKKDRKRRYPKANPESVYRGIRLRNSFNI